MTDISSYDGTRLFSLKDTRQEFSGTGDDVRIGIEAEYQLTQASDHSRPMTITQNERLGKLLSDQAVELSQEATAQTVEIKTNAYKANEFLKLEREFLYNFNALARGASDLDLKLHDKAILEEISFSQLLEHLNSRERAQIFFHHFLNHDRKDVARYFSRVSGAQISMSYHHEQHGFELYRRVVLLAPLLCAIYQNLPSHVTSDDGEKELTKGNLSLAFRLSAYSLNGAVPESLWRADKAQDFFDQLNEELWQQPLFCYYDQAGEFKGVQYKEDICSFEDLPGELKTKANFQLLSSTQWHLASFSHLPADDLGAQKRRIELRYLDSLPPKKLLEVTALFSKLAFDQNLAKECDAFLQGAGFDFSNLRQCKDLWQSNIGEAVHAESLNTHIGHAPIKDVKKEFIQRFINN